MAIIEFTSENTINRDPKINSKSPIINVNKNKIIHIPIKNKAWVDNITDVPKHYDNNPITSLWGDGENNKIPGSNTWNTSNTLKIYEFGSGDDDIKTIFNLRFTDEGWNQNHDNGIIIAFYFYRLGESGEATKSYLVFYYHYGTLTCNFSEWDQYDEKTLIAENFNISIGSLLQFEFYLDDDSKLVINSKWGSQEVEQIVLEGFSARVPIIAMNPTNAYKNLEGYRYTEYLTEQVTSEAGMYHSYSLPWNSH